MTHVHLAVLEDPINHRHAVSSTWISCITIQLDDLGWGFPFESLDALWIPWYPLGIPAMPPSSLMGSLAVAGAAVATTLSLQWLWARATARVRRGRKGYSSIDAAKDAEVVKGAPWQPWGGSFQHCLKILVRYLKKS